jgi:hypothetical protein
LAVFTWSGSAAWSEGVEKRDRARKRAARDREDSLGISFSPRHNLITRSGRVMPVRVESPVLLLLLFFLIMLVILDGKH